MDVLGGTTLQVEEGGGGCVSGKWVVALGAAMGTSTVRPAVETGAVLGVVGTSRSAGGTTATIVAVVARARVGVAGTGARKGLIQHLLHLGQESSVAGRRVGDGRVDGFDGRVDVRSGRHGVEETLRDSLGHVGHGVGLKEHVSGGGEGG